MVSFPYYSHTTPIRIPKDMGMVPAYHKGVPCPWGSLESPLKKSSKFHQQPPTGHCSPREVWLKMCGWWIPQHLPSLWWRVRCGNGLQKIMLSSFLRPHDRVYRSVWHSLLPRKLKAGTWKRPLGRGKAFTNHQCLGSMIVFGGVLCMYNICISIDLYSHDVHVNVAFLFLIIWLIRLICYVCWCVYTRYTVDIIDIYI